MPIPKHLNTVVVKNKYYPGGLTEGQVWSHYQKNKPEILKEINRKPVTLFIYTDINEWIVKRKLFNSSFTLDNSNYTSVLTGRTVSISAEQGKMTEFWIIDIDPGPSVNEMLLKDCITDLISSTIFKIPTVKGMRIISTSKGYHFYILLKKKMNIDVSRRILFKMLTSEFTGKYLINKKSPKGPEINLDLSPTSFRGSHVVPGALTRNGLVAVDCTRNWESFTRQRAVI